MSKRRGIGVAVLVAGLMLLALGWGSLAAAKSNGPTPPTIDEILGTWTASASYVDYDTSTGEPEKIKDKATYTITKVSDSTVYVQYLGQDGLWSWNGEAYYANGILMWGASDDTSLGSWAGTESWVITGKPGHLTAKGQWIDYDISPPYMDVGTRSLKQTSD
jgi:hypothetical protein